MVLPFSGALRRILGRSRRILNVAGGLRISETAATSRLPHLLASLDQPPREYADIRRNRSFRRSPVGEPSGPPRQGGCKLGFEAAWAPRNAESVPQDTADSVKLRISEMRKLQDMVTSIFRSALRAMTEAAQ